MVFTLSFKELLDLLFVKIFPRSMARFAAIQAVYQKLIRKTLTSQNVVDEFTRYRFHDRILQKPNLENKENHTCSKNQNENSKFNKKYETEYAIFEDDFYVLDCELFCHIVHGVDEKSEDLVIAISKALPENWFIDKLENSTSALLQCATFELLFCKEIPREVILNEYVIAAQVFLLEKGPAFVNGLLETLSLQEKIHQNNSEMPTSSSLVDEVFINEVF